MTEPVNPPVLQRIAPGLVNYFGIKNLGRGNPEALSTILSGVLELSEWYFKPAIEVVTANAFNFSLGGQVVPLPGTVSTATPDDELWIVWSAKCQTVGVLTAGQSLQMNLGTALSNGASAQNGPDSVLGIAGDLPSCGYFRPMMLMPHTFVVVHGSRLIAGPIPGSCSLHITRFKTS